jgi:chromosome segregation protein
VPVVLINRLRLTGFKSFVEPTDLVIAPGLTGVVGPNGCGKSNLLEALRWVMGETSYKSMRASTMEDVIFSGTATRPARNMAEVAITIDNADRKAPAEFNAEPTLEISRRIERDAGSTYRINGREARAKDIRILFEDAATGARSPALVRQGQIGEIVNAKPEQRRRILEDAAGIAGLHSRRHDAELRLKAAEGNLARIGDIAGQMATQIETLKRQARQAKRYQEISAAIRRCEATLLYLRWLAATETVTAEETAFREVQAELTRLTEAEALAVVAETEATAQLEPLRKAEAEAAAKAARLAHEVQAIGDERKRAAARLIELESRTSQLENDLEREQAQRDEAETVLNERRAAAASLADTARETRVRLTTLEDANKTAATALAEADKAVQEAADALAQADRQSATLAARVDDRKAEVARAEAAHQRAIEAHDRHRATAPDTGTLDAHEASRAQAIETLAALDAERADAIRALDTAQSALDAARGEARRAALDANALAVERDTLAKLVAAQPKAKATDQPTALDLLTVEPGYEAAIGAALGDDLHAAIDAARDRHWNSARGRKSLDVQWPDGVRPLTEVVEAPEALSRMLSAVGVVVDEAADSETVAQLADDLGPGLRLVTRTGDLYRWDGFTVPAGAAATPGKILAERNRLTALKRKATAAAKASDAAGETERAAVAAFNQARKAVADVETRQRTAIAERDTAQRAIAAIEAAHAAFKAQDAQLADRVAQAKAAISDAETRLAEALTAQAEQPDRDPLRERLTELQAAATAARDARDTARTDLRLAEQQRDQLEGEKTAIDADIARWSARRTAADKTIADRTQQLAGTRHAYAELQTVPAQLEAKANTLMDEAAAAETARGDASDRIARATTAAHGAVQALKSAQSAVGAARESRARCETRLEGARRARAEAATEIEAKLQCAPRDAASVAELDINGPLPEIDATEAKLQKLTSDRDRLGGVNLQAVSELETLEAEYERISAEAEDVEAAVRKLRAAIGRLNGEARKRLTQAFDSVNAKFGELFETLFGGGEARLELISSDDPLESGLEIIAKPPGKKPATLSLLSGGEQTLTALSLIFAVFLTNPSPICVLDEVDAPLDDANVERFCALMDNMTERTDTRFLVITHHPMTMSRMHRLFGVTMSERGVSQLVSVNLEVAEELLEAG